MKQKHSLQEGETLEFDALLKLIGDDPNEKEPIKLNLKKDKNATLDSMAKNIKKALKKGSGFGVTIDEVNKQ